MSILKKRSIAIIAMLLLMTILMSAMSIVSFADDGHDHDHEESESSTEKKEEEKTGLAKFWDTYNEWFGYGLAVIVLVAMVILVIWWIPKDNKPKAKKSTK